MQSRIEVSEAEVDRALEGDPRAIEQLVRGLERPFYALSRRMGLSAADAEESTQEALLRVITRLSQWDRRAKFSTWAWRIAVNQSIDHRARRRRLPLLTSDAIGAEIAQGLELEAVERAEDRALVNELKAACTLAMLSVLDDEQRAAFVLGDVLELPGDEAADALSIEPAAYRKRLSRARDALRAALTANCGMVDPANPCRCHRRLRRARASLDREDFEGDSVSTQRESLASLGEVERVIALYRADRGLTARRDLAQRVVGLLRTTSNPRA